jgi:NhaA family Na+:H+ antiporter
MTQEDPAHAEPALPREPIHRVTAPFERFLHVEAASGVVLLVCTLIALVLANTGAAEDFRDIWKTRLGFDVGSFSMHHSLRHWINDGLMVLFFFVIGLEVKREIVIGELRDLKRASLPIAAAIGGMLVPAGIYFLLQRDGAAPNGWGIPMATDIAFVVGCMAVLGDRIPRGLRVMMLSLAIADDIGAILVIAVFYTTSIDWTMLALGAAGIASVWTMARVGIRSFGLYTIAGLFVWFAFHESGVHATIAGVILGLMTPAHSYISKSVFAQFADRAGAVIRGDDWDAESHRPARIRRFTRAARETVSPLEYLEGLLHPWMGFAVMPIFALANAGVAFQIADATSAVALAVAAGLVIGKPVGIVLVSFLAVKIGVATLPKGVGWGAIMGGGLLAGIGFTMALFIAGLANLGDSLDEAKVGVLAASAFAGVAGIGVLVAVLPRPGAPSRRE